MGAVLFSVACVCFLPACVCGFRNYNIYDAILYVMSCVAYTFRCWNRAMSPVDTQLACLDARAPPNPASVPFVPFQFQ